MDSNLIRKTFLDFFKRKGHQILPSAPMVIKDDPTLMFTNAGMNQFKDIFLNNIPPKHKRVANTQKCLRVSGKHNDLEEVGVDTYHHTMFEMLGNWSFGDYFKKEAIEWAWELLVNVYGIDADRLYVTVFEGDKSDKLPEDNDGYNVWKKIVPGANILKFGKNDNFWEMGDTGPCGPCSEIHIDIRDAHEREKIDGKSLVNKNHPQVIELWNLVFIEFNRLANGELKPLPGKHVDTGMGFERLCMVLQHKKSNYDTDVFQPLIEKIEDKSSQKYGSTQQKTDIAIRVIADHVRAIAFSIADGQLPFREGAGYVIRRILRRAVRYGYSFLGFNKAFIYELVPVLIEQMGEQFPEIKIQKELIQKVIKEEEESFLRTLENGINRFQGHILKYNPIIIDGIFAFELYDTYGFPVDLTELLAREYNLSVSIVAFNRCMQEQKERSKKASEVEIEDWIEIINFLPSVNLKESFIGYDSLKADVRIVKYRKIKAKEKVQYQLVFDKTPFYAESGGQVGDTGVLETDGERITILDTKKENELIVHFAEKLPAEPGKQFIANVDTEKRKATECNHSATHLLHAALRAVLGSHIKQKGSLVDSAHLRFDFSHFSKVTAQEIVKIENLMNEKIRENIPIDIRHLPLKEAKKTGARALFGEKYGEVVRVVTFDRTFSIELCGGTHVKATGEIGLFKITSETAIAAGIRRIEAITSTTAEIRNNEQLQKAEKLQNDLEKAKKLLCLIPLDDSKSQNVHELTTEIKSIEDVLSKISELSIHEQLSTLSPSIHTPLSPLNRGETSARFSPSNKRGPGGVSSPPVQDFINQNNELNKRLEKLKKTRANIIKEELLTKIEKINGINYIIEKVALDNASIKSVAFQLKAQIDNLFLALGAEDNGKAHLTVLISDNLVTPSPSGRVGPSPAKAASARVGGEGLLNAAEIIREIAKEIHGGGGGQPFYATAGGKYVKGIENALKKAKKLAT